MSQYADAIKLSKQQWEEINAVEGNGPATKLYELVRDRLSRKRCKERIPQLVRAGVIKITTPEALFRWTYGTAQVEGSRAEGVPGRKEAKIPITKAQWTKVSAERIAEVLEQAQTEKRAAYCMSACILARVFKPTAQDVVDLTNNRVQIESVGASMRVKKGLDPAKLIDGIMTS